MIKNCHYCNHPVGDNQEDQDITENEIQKVIDMLCISKAPGIDGINNNIIKKGSHIIVPLLCDLFNKVLKSGEYPDKWCEAIIVPIHKKGDVNNPNNYRGIALNLV